MTRCKIPEFCDRYSKDFGKHDLRSKRILPKTDKEEKICSNVHKSHYCVFWKKIEEIVYLMG